MTIGIIGGSSQVGSSVAYYLKNYSDVNFKCFVRSSYSQVFFDLLNIAYEKFDINNSMELKHKLEECDTVLDFSFPTGQLSGIPDAIDNILTHVISSMQPGATFIYMSSIMAYGMDANEKFIRNTFFSHTPYAFIKRKAEARCLALGKKFGINAYNFRLGQVHGFLQSVNTSFREKLKDKKVVFIDGSPGDLTNTVFINTIAEAILNFSKEKHSPGTYTLVNNPQWTLTQLYEFYIKFYDIQTSLQFIPSFPNSTSLNFKSKVFGKLKKYRPLLESYFLIKFPKLSSRIKGKYRELEIANIVSSLKSGKIDYIDYNLLGRPDGKLIPLLNCGFDEVYEIEKTMESGYEALINMNRK